MTFGSSGGSVKSQSVLELNQDIFLKPDSSPHDVILVAKLEGDKAIRCHKCILVARSGKIFIYLFIYLFSSDYFQSMLLMGWREVGELIIIFVCHVCCSLVFYSRYSD